MSLSAIHHRERLQQPCTGKVSEVCLIETGGTADLPYFLQWIRLAQVRRGILLLVDIPHYEAHALEILREIAAIGVDIIRVNFPGGQAVRAGSHSFPLPATDLMMGILQSSAGRRALHIGHHARHDYTTLRHHSGFRSVARKLGFDTITCRERDRPVMEGGDYIQVGDHVFIGRRTEQDFGADAAAHIRQYYDLGDRLHIHVTGVHDPSPAAGLYHLDLYFTYAGLSATGRHRFMTGYIDEASIGDPLIPHMREQLDRFAREIDVTLCECYGPEGYEIISVPIMVCDIYRISPLNGILDQVGSEARYYFPWPKFVDAELHPAYDTQARITQSVSRAYEIISAHMGAGNVVRFDFPIYYAAGSGQSLHCTMAVLGRQAV